MSYFFSTIDDTHAARKKKKRWEGKTGKQFRFTDSCKVVLYNQLCIKKKKKQKRKNMQSQIYYLLPSTTNITTIPMETAVEWLRTRLILPKNNNNRPPSPRLPPPSPSKKTPNPQSKTNEKSQPTNQTEKKTHLPFFQKFEVNDFVDTDLLVMKNF